MAAVMTRNNLLFVAALRLNSAAWASGPSSQSCTHWQLGKDAVQADGGMVSQECTCTTWAGDSSGERYGCNQCEQFTGNTAVSCVEMSSVPMHSSGCSSTGAEASLPLLALALAGALTLRRRSNLDGNAARHG